MIDRCDTSKLKNVHTDSWGGGNSLAHVQIVYLFKRQLHQFSKCQVILFQHVFFLFISCRGASFTSALLHFVLV